MPEARNILKTLRLVVALALVPIAVTVSLTSLQWVGRVFPGFFVMANRVVPSVGLNHWSGIRNGNFYQATVVTVNSQPVNSSTEIYSLVETTAPGTPISYTLARAGKLYDRTVPSMRFSTGDYLAMFVAYLLNGMAYTVVAIYAALGAGTQISYALFSLGLSAGLFALTGTDLYYPHHFFRLHAMAEAFFPASLIHLALVLPRNWLRKTGSLALIPYLVTLPLATAYQMVLFDPGAYPVVHNAASLYLGVAGCLFLVTLGYGYWTETVVERKKPLGVIGLGALVGLGPPAILMMVSGISGGAVPVNFSAYTAFLFPSSLAYASLKNKIPVHQLDGDE